jgi:hypothetical protein
MNPKILVRALAILTVSAALTGTPELSFAQHGGHGGGGGFHGGGFHGGGFHGGGFGGFAGGVHGGRGFGNFHGSAGLAHYHGGFGGSYGHRGFYGYGGRGFYGYGGYPGYGSFYGYGGYPFFFGINFGFGFGSYWSAYPYSYGYGPWWGPSGYYSPYPSSYYPYDAEPDYRDHRCNTDYRDPNDGCAGNSGPSSDIESAPSNTIGHETSSDSNYVTTNFVDYQTAAHTSVRIRPAVRNAIGALRAMPPEARERQLNSGRYDGFSPQERELLGSVAESLDRAR